MSGIENPWTTVERHRVGPHDAVTVLISTELLEKMNDVWSVQISIVRTPGIGSGYEMTARTHTCRPVSSECSCWHHIGKLDCPIHGHEISDGNCRHCASSQAEIDNGLVPIACTGRKEDGQ